MRKVVSAVLSCALAVWATRTSRAVDATWEYSVQVSAVTQTSPPQITLTWPQDTLGVPSSYVVYRKSPGASSWGKGRTLPGATTRYVDSNITAGSTYEYQVVKNAAGYAGYGYIYAGIDAPLIENRGKIILVVDNTYAGSLSSELARLQQDLTGDGWTVIRQDVSRNESVPKVKALIKAHHNADPANVKAVFLFGHVPVPYSGNLVPDGHAPDHRGAWPADVYYGDMAGDWTDDSVNTTSAADPRNRNVPGDGKFDQSEIPSDVALEVGRVDLANMPGRLSYNGPATFPTELELLRNYLNKDHNFRHKLFTAPARAVVGDYFGNRQGEAFAASAWRNFAPFFGPAQITTLPTPGTWIATLATNSYLWAYGCGAGSFTSIGGLGKTGVYHDGLTTELVGADIRAVFTFLYGSWLGDWDSEDNMLRSPLATQTYGLTCAWSGRPHWFCHHMALGETIGFSTRLTQNNGKDGLYRNEVNSVPGQTQIALMGDPTLRMHPVAPASSVTATANACGATLNWNPSSESVVGYHVYRATTAAGPFTRLTSSPITTTSYADTTALTGATTYMVRAVKRETTASGSYFNPSQGAFATLNGVASPALLISSATNASPITSDSPTNNLAPTGRVKSARATDATTEQMFLTPTGYVTNDTTWLDDALPAGAISGVDGGDTWNWTSTTPTPNSGAKTHQSAIAASLHQQHFDWATATLAINVNENLFAYVYLDPANPPSEVMLQWNDGSWEHRAYWGANSILWGTTGTVGRTNMGALPPAGQWVRLEVPASKVGLEGSTLKGMAFTLYGGRATWDSAGKSAVSISSTNTTPPTNTIPPITGTNIPPSTNTSSLGTNNPGVSVVDYTALELPKPGDNALHILSPTILEVKLINTKPADPGRVTTWDFVDSNYNFAAPAASAFAVTVNGQSVAVQSVGFKRRPLYAPLATRDLRIDNTLVLQLASSIADGQTVEVKNPSGSLWSSSMKFIATADPLRYSPAIHVNQEGYVPAFPKKAMVGYYLGNFGEMNISASLGFKLVDANTGVQVYQGSLTLRPDTGWTYSPTPYQKVLEADFSSFTTAGEYRLVVSGLGASLPFMIHEGVAMAFARTYALGLYHQRCGTNNVMPFTRFTHDACHTARAAVPSPQSSYPFTWTTIANYTLTSNPDNPPQSAPRMSSEAAQLFPFVNKGTLEVSGGHHDAGDYSKYTMNSASLTHLLMFAADSLPGVSALDNLGIPESGDGISDVLQEAKWEADYLAKIQDADGGFYFLVYPKDREYENNALPEHGDPQVVWPKTSTATAAGVAALAQCASSPLMKQYYPQAASNYLAKAQLGWNFLMNAINRYGKTGIYQKITHYGDTFADYDELAWAACEMFLATGNPSYQQQLIAWFNPDDPATRRWSWWRMSESYGHATRSFAFAVRSGRLAASQLDATFLAKCQAQVTTCGDDNMTWAQQSAYGTSFPPATKGVRGAGWYFSIAQAFDVAVAYQLNPRPEYLSAMLLNMNYEGGCNPVNVTYVTGLGWKRQREIVSQYAQNDRHVLPPDGIPLGNVQFGFPYSYNYAGELRPLCFPSDEANTAPYPFYDRWGDAFNVTTEFVNTDQARGLGCLAFLSTLTSVKTQPWTSAAGQITVTGAGTSNSPSVAILQVPGLDLSGARIVWEARDQEPAFGPTFIFVPKNSGTQWIEAEAQWPDGRRVFATTTSTAAEPPTVVWGDDALPTGASTGAEGGDSWSWVSASPPANSGTLAHQSAIAAGLHQHYFDNTSATLTINTGDKLFAYIYLDPANVPSEVMLQWNDGSWEHRAYWGANSIGYGTDGTAGRRYMGPLPAAGQWVRLEVPASSVGLEGRTLKGMAFTLYGGRATWDNVGRSTQITNPGSGGSVAVSSLRVNGAGATLTWNSALGKVYQVSYKNSLTDAIWTPASVEITALGTATSWTDTAANTRNQRFYVVTLLR